MWRILLCCLLLLACAKHPRLASRKFHIVNLGLPRTGTTSFAGIFDKFPATHEFMISETIPVLLDFHEGKISAAALADFLHERDARAGHWVDSASFFFFAPEAVIRAFPEARFFFALRDCESWVLSMVDNSLFVHRMIREGRATVDLRFLDRYSEFFIRGHERRMFLDQQHLSRNAQHIVTELAAIWGKYSLRLAEAMLAVPPQRRLVIRLGDFNASLDSIAAFAGVQRTALNEKNLHLNKDRSLSAVRQLLKGAPLTAICAPHQIRLDGWFRAQGNLSGSAVR